MVKARADGNLSIGCGACWAIALQSIEEGHGTFKADDNVESDGRIPDEPMKDSKMAAKGYSTDSPWWSAVAQQWIL